MQAPIDFDTESFDMFLELETSDPVTQLTSSWIQQAAIRSALRVGNEALAVRFAISIGVRDENKLTDLVFYTRYPQQWGKPLARGDPLIRKWIEIRDRLVRPLINQPTTPSPSPSAITPVAAGGCNKVKRLTVGTTPVWGVPGDTAFFFKTGMSIDADGAARAYHPHGKGLDYLGNAGQPRNWWGIVTNTRKRTGTPIIQGPSDPAPGYYVSTTSLTDSRYAATDPRRYVDATQIPYIALPGGRPARYAQLGASLGDFTAVINTRNNRIAYAIFADVGPARHIGEGSIALAQALGHNPFKSNGKAAIGIGGGLIYVVFPNSGNGHPRSLSTINAEGARLFNSWGGLARATACLP